MNAAIFKNELKANRRFAIIWTVVLVLTIGVNIGSGVSDSEDGPPLDIINAFARSVTSTVLMGGIFAMILGGMVISQEEDEKTIEFLLGHPVTRIELATSKFLAFTLLVGLFSVVLLAADFVFFEIFTSTADYDLGAMLGIWVSEMVLVYLFGCTGLFVSAFVTKGGGIVGIGIGLPIITAILEQLAYIDNSPLSLLSYLSPYRYLDTAGIISRGGAKPLFVIIFVMITVAFVIATFTVYRKRQFAV